MTVLDHCTVKGGKGWLAPACWTAGAPGEGLLLKGGVLLCTGSTLRGENGAIGSCEKASGAPGLIMQGNDPFAIFHDSVVEAGLTVPCSGTPLPDPPVVVLAGQVQILTGAAHDFEVASPVREGEAIALQLAGESGQTAFVAVSLAQDHSVLVEWQGAALLDLSFSIADVLTVPASGPFSSSLPAVQFAPGMEGLPLYLQAAFVGPGGITLSPGSSLLLLDAAH